MHTQKLSIATIYYNIIYSYIVIYSNYYTNACTYVCKHKKKIEIGDDFKNEHTSKHIYYFICTEI